MNWTVKLSSRNLTITSEQLANFRKPFMVNECLSGRISELLWLDSYVLCEEYGVSPDEIMAAVKNLEAGEPFSSIKQSSPFKHPPLKGFWHKHYFSARFLPANISLANGKAGIKKLVYEVMDPKKSKVITLKMIEDLAHRVTNEALDIRHAQGKITGEWIVFIKHKGKNIYLCLTTHKTEDQLIFNRILKHCRRDYPDLLEWVQLSNR